MEEISNLGKKCEPIDVEKKEKGELTDRTDPKGKGFLHGKIFPEQGGAAVIYRKEEDVLF